MKSKEYVHEIIQTIFVPIENIFKKMIVFLFVCLFISQLALSYPIARPYISETDKLEGETIATMEARPIVQVATEQRWIELQLLEDKPRDEISVYYNQQKIASFSELNVKIPLPNEAALEFQVQGVPGVYAIQVTETEGLDNANIFPGQIIEVSQNAATYIQF